MFVLLLTASLWAQDDAKHIQSFYETSLENGMSYSWLDHLSNEIGGRLSGSENAEKAVAYVKTIFPLISFGFISFISSIP